MRLLPDRYWGEEASEKRAGSTREEPDRPQDMYEEL